MQVNPDEDIVIRRSTRSKRRREEWEQTLVMEVRTSRGSSNSSAKVAVSSLGGQPSHKKNTGSAVEELQPFCGSCGHKHTGTNLFCVKCGKQRERCVVQNLDHHQTPAPETDEEDEVLTSCLFVYEVLTCLFANNIFINN